MNPMASGGSSTDRKVVLLGRPLPEYRVALKEVDRLEIEAGRHRRHDGEVFLAGDVVEPQGVP
jgi:hypothetical protein